ncbi:Ig-like domain-containing protein [Pseudomonas sp. ANT_H12B]|uniref:Ig-like domain-containing protein n=1 Tax=Pseudomonas sp. ANT_H12B TaxID=2597348 RepID=UPI0011EFE8E8|nr:Ig-like domain-containing protein [Pseudomonas sp. ANT_H12B]KAA0975044.1 hypothetical protein FQ185_10725 [Pseudomonas sp. ANT_H12B]
MDIQSSVLNQLFVLYPVIIQGWVSPLKPADLAQGGIPKSLYDGQPQGLECLVDPWTELQLLSWTMAADDRVDLYVNDDPTPVTGKTVAPGEEQLRIRLYVPHGRLRNGVNRLHYKVIRPGGSSEDSRDLNVLYYLRSPGEPAPNGLDLVIPPDVVKDGVDAARAAQGVEFGFTYSNRRAYDRIRFQLGDESVEWEITDASVPATKTLFTGTFQQGGDNPNLLLDFVVFDQLGNFSRSSTKQIDVHLGRVNLSAAILREIPSENNDDPSLVDLRKLNGGPLWALIHLIDTIWNEGDEIRLSFTAMVNGSVVATHEETRQITQVPGLFSWDIPNSKVIPDSSVRVGYEQIRGGKVIASSKIAIALVVGERLPELTIDVSNMLLNGKNYITTAFDWIRKAAFPGSTAQRVASGGTPPYRYSSSSPSIAAVDSTGVVSSVSNGSARITVTDSSPEPQSKSYVVYTSNVYLLLNNSSPLSAEEADAWRISVGGLRLEPGDHGFLSRCYAPGYLPPAFVTYHTGRRNNQYPQFPNHPVTFAEQRHANGGNFNQGVNTEKDPRLPAICRKLA